MENTLDKIDMKVLPEEAIRILTRRGTGKKKGKKGVFRGSMGSGV